MQNGGYEIQYSTPSVATDPANLIHINALITTDVLLFWVLLFWVRLFIKKDPLNMSGSFFEPISNC